MYKGSLETSDHDELYIHPTLSSSSPNEYDITKSRAPRIFPLSQSFTMYGGTLIAARVLVPELAVPTNGKKAKVECILASY